MTNNRLQTEAMTRNEPYHKDAQAFAQGEGPCYWAGGASYTRSDFMQVANGEVSIAEQLFSLIDGPTLQKGLYKLVNEGALRVPDYISDEGKRTVLIFQGAPLPTVDHQQLLKAHGWEALFPELAYPSIWTRQVPDAPVPYGIAFTDLVKRSEPEVNESFEEGHDHE